MKISAMLKAASFAHLLGLPAARAEERDDEKKQRDDESDEDYAKRMEENDEDQKDAKAEDGDEEDKKSKADDEDAEEDEKDEGDKKSRKAKKAEEGDDDESMKAARKSERARCATIFGSQAAGARPDLAAHLAFNTDMSSKEAIALLGAAAIGGRPRGLADRMAGIKVPNVGSDASEPAAANSPKAVAAKIIAAAAKARGEK